ncbi:CHAT domain-containing protein [Streptomyces kunmingensis]|uniref:CHAT domain-containing protein n=1 Tax=Streptomyces kunmingensis TaxID=68225 RepID=A0ABU6C9H6_9ACTN|nr:CHAT domain-containing protein [Streptomyces kunmingensis]MEB3961372.1 CHAT domain-containing protein [Streptomyces kunmingensis]
MAQELTVEIVRNPSSGYTIPPPRAGQAVGGGVHRDLRVLLRHADRDGLTITTYASWLPPREQWLNARLETAPQTLLDRAGTLRSEWKRLVVDHTNGTPGPGMRVGGRPLSEQADLTHHATLVETVVKSLADEGFDVLDVMLDGRGSSLGRLREFLLGALAEEKDLRISFDSDLPMPWPMLAVDPSVGIDPWDAFLGHRHQVEQTSSGYDWVDQAKVSPRLRAVTSLNTDSTLDKVGRASDVRDLLAARSELTVRTEAKDLLEALGNEFLLEDLMYFWCHGKFLEEGTRNRRLVIKLSDPDLIDGAKVTRRRRRLRGGQQRFKPFVLLNACHTGQAATDLHVGHLGAALIDLGADGVLGPQIEIPQIFASEYAYSFLDLYLEGRHTAGEISQALVKRFSEKFHNPLALTYSLHCGLHSRLNLAS